MKGIVAAAFLAALPACTGSGSEVGPTFGGFSGSSLRGWVFAPDGAPVSSALVSVVGSIDAAATDSTGRFRLDHPPTGLQVVEVDGRRAGAVGAGDLGRLRFARTVSSGRDDLDAPVVLADLDAGARRVVPLGSLAGEAPLDAAGPGGSPHSLLLDPADGTHPPASAAFADPSSHPGETTVRLSMVAVLPRDLPASASTGAGERTVVAFLVDPPDVVFSPGASFRVPNRSGLAAGAPLALRRLDFATGEWTPVAGGAVVEPGGTTVVGWNAVLAGGLHALVESGPGILETYTGRILDASDEPVEAAIVVAPDGASSRSDSDGTFAFVAGAPLPPDGPAVVVVPPGHFTHARTVASLAAGTPAAFGDVVLRTRGGSTARGLAVLRGRPLGDTRVGIGSAEANFGAFGLSDAGGRTQLDGAPSGRYWLSAAFRDGEFIYRATRSFPVGEDGGVSEQKVFPEKTRFRARRVRGRVLVTVVREDSLAPIEDAFVMLGTASPINARRAFTNRLGRAILERAGEEPVTITAGVVWTTVEGDLPVGPSGNPVAERRFTVYRTIAGVDAAQIVIPLPALGPAGARVAPSGRVDGAASGLTDPSIVPPSNPSGTYAVALSAHGDATEDDLWDAFDEGTLDDEPVPVGDASVGFPSGGGAPDASFSVGARAGLGTLVAVERDSADPSIGPVTRLGFASEIEVEAGRATTRNLALDLVPSASFAFTAPGFEPALGAPRAILGALFPASSGPGRLARFGDLTDGGSFDPASGAGAVPSPAPSGPLGGATRVLRLEGEATLGPLAIAQRAFVREASGGGFFPGVPSVFLPTPGGADFDPTGGGVLWSAPAGATVQRLTLGRTEIAVEGTIEVERGFEWSVFLPGGASAFVFPTLPAEVGNQAVPPYFAPGATHALAIDALALGDPFPFDAFFAHRDAVRFSEYRPVGASRAATIVGQP